MGVSTVAFHGTPILIYRVSIVYVSYMYRICIVYVPYIYRS